MLARLLRAAVLLVVAATSLSMPSPCAAGAQGGSRPPLLVFAAASLTDALGEVSDAYTRATGQPVKLSFAASAALARQLEAGARADAFVSADTEWMDYVDARGLIERASRRDVLGNRLVLVAPKGSRIELTIAPGFPLAKALGRGRLATGDPDYVPAGRYARSALIGLGVWNDVVDRLVRADNVRVALAFVARGEAPLGIVYETDARVEPAVRVVGLFPAGTHPPIVYPAAAMRGAKAGAADYVDFIHGDAARAIFRRYGFTVLP